MFQSFFENTASLTTSSKLVVEPIASHAIEEAEGWGDDDDEIIDGGIGSFTLFDFVKTNVFYFVAEEKSNDPKVSESGEAGWDVEDADLDIPELGPTPGEETTDSYVHLPAQGTS